MKEKHKKAMNNLARISQDYTLFLEYGREFLWSLVRVFLVGFLAGGITVAILCTIFG